MKTCFKTVLVLSEDFVEELWRQVSNTVSLSLRTPELVGGRLRDDVVVIVCDPLCIIPSELFNFARVYLDNSDLCRQRLFDLLTTSGMCMHKYYFFIFLSFFSPCHSAEGALKMTDMKLQDMKLTDQ